MPLLELGSIGYQIGAVGILVFTLAFLASVRWWSDSLGRVMAAVLTTTSGMLVVTAIRQIWPDIDGAIFVWRAIVFWLFGIAVWASIGTFLWAQFFAPRLKRIRGSRMSDHTHGGK